MSADEPKRVVFDCMVFLQGAANKAGPSGSCIELFESGRIELFLSADVLSEVRDVFTRPKFQRKFSALTPENVDSLLSNWLGKATLISKVAKVFQYERDPKDEKYINLALAANAQYLVSRDLDLLDLMDETLPAGKDFRRRFPNLRIINPIAFLQEL